MSIINTPSHWSDRVQANMRNGVFRDRTLAKMPGAVDISKATTVDEALDLIGANFTVKKLPIYVRLPDVESAGQVVKSGVEVTMAKGLSVMGNPYDLPMALVPDAGAMWRLGPDGKPVRFLATVGSKYEFLQPLQSFECTQILAKAGATFDKGYLSDDSRHIYLRMKVAEQEILGDTVVGYVSMSDSYDGTASFRIDDELFRVVCQNGLIELVPGRNRIRKRHTKGILLTAEQARKMVLNMEDTLRNVRAQAESLSKIHLSENRWMGIIEQLLPYPTPPAGEPSLTPRQRDWVDEQRATLYMAMQADDLGNHRWTGWGAVNAVSDFVSHLGNVQKLGDSDRQVRKLIDVGRESTLITQAKELVLALN